MPPPLEFATRSGGAVMAQSGRLTQGFRDGTPHDGEIRNGRATLGYAFRQPDGASQPGSAFFGAPCEPGTPPAFDRALVGFANVSFTGLFIAMSGMAER